MSIRGRAIFISKGLLKTTVSGLLEVGCEKLAISLMDYRLRATFKLMGAIEGDWKAQ